MEWHRKNFDSERRSPPDAGFPCGNPKGSEQGNFARPANKHPIRRKINPPVSLGQIPAARQTCFLSLANRDVSLRPSRGGAAGFRVKVEKTWNVVDFVYPTENIRYDEKRDSPLCFNKAKSRRQDKPASFPSQIGRLFQPITRRCGRLSMRNGWNEAGPVSRLRLPGRRLLRHGFRQRQRRPRLLRGGTVLRCR